ncbi:hypothetical protein PtA15_7A162 [Puccinia triticina]|uniref:Uncharacterized protein n=1 Tax=Puccinia triticina TaxID=208348 RepID=A0ABY7CMI3_9BASI|nr:uncharacterized protein PtA15_7A162 [Puccinia triticina]WAQ86436.1 hypothetical protein PtA15_7A162 [Puccinia triticina]
MTWTSSLSQTLSTDLGALGHAAQGLPACVAGSTYVQGAELWERLAADSKPTAGLLNAHWSRFPERLQTERIICLYCNGKANRTSLPLLTGPSYTILNGSQAAIF